MESVRVSKDKFVSDFTEITEIVRKNYSLLACKHINNNTLFKHYLHAVKCCNSGAEYVKVVLEYFSCLKNSHILLYLNEYTAGYSARLVEDRFYVDKVHREIVTSDNIGEKEEIIEVEGLPALRWAEQQRKYFSASTDAHQLYGVIKSIFTSRFESERNLLIQSDSGNKEVYLVLNNLVSLMPVPPSIDGFLLRKDIGYIAIRRMESNAVALFEFTYSILRKLPSLILDLRENEGGCSEYGEQIIIHLIKKEQKALISGKLLVPAEDCYVGKLVVLIGNGTFSAAESFVLDLKENRSAILVGSPTAGDTGNNPRSFTTRNGLSFRLPTRKPFSCPENGFPTEGMGIQPDYERETKLVDYLKNIDTVLEYAVSLLKGEPA